MRFAAVAGTILVLIAACGGGQPTTTSRATTGPGASVAASAVAPTTVAGCSGTVGLPVAIANFAFTPATITVPVGGSVTWANADTAPHTVTFDNGPDCGRLATAGTVTRTFDTAGTFAYHCAIHPAMTASVTVQ